MKHKAFLEHYGFSQSVIEKLLKKGKYNAPYGVIEVKGDNLITTYENGETKTEKMA